MKRQKIGEGNTAEIFVYEPGKILKLFREKLPDKACDREWRNTKQAGMYFSFVPKVYGKISENGRQGIIYEQLSGGDMLKRMLLCFWKRRRYARELARLHVQMHQKKYAGSSKECPVLSVKEKLSEDIQAAGELSLEEKARWVKELEKLPEGDKICHFDYHPGNVIMDGKRSVVIDWMTLCIGNPAADVARTKLLLKDAVVPVKSVFVKKMIQRFQGKICQAYLEEYQRLTGMNEERIAVWEKVICAARLREWIPEEEKRRLLQRLRG